MYSDRPQLVLACEMVGWDKTLSLMPYGDVWRSVRKYFHNIVGSRELGKFLPMIENESSKLLISLLCTPQDFLEHVRRCVMFCLIVRPVSRTLNVLSPHSEVGSVSLMLAYGYETKPYNDYLVELADRGNSDFALLTAPGAFLVDVLPICKSLALPSR